MQQARRRIDAARAALLQGATALRTATEQTHLVAAAASRAVAAVLAVRLQVDALSCAGIESLRAAALAGLTARARRANRATLSAILDIVHDVDTSPAACLSSRAARTSTVFTRHAARTSVVAAPAVQRVRRQGHTFAAAARIALAASPHATDPVCHALHVRLRQPTVDRHGFAAGRRGRAQLLVEERFFRASRHDQCPARAQR